MRLTVGKPLAVAAASALALAAAGYAAEGGNGRFGGRPSTPPPRCHADRCEGHGHGHHGHGADDDGPSHGHHDGAGGSDNGD
jgi:hypothetical protein